MKQKIKVIYHNVEGKIIVHCELMKLVFICLRWFDKIVTEDWGNFLKLIGTNKDNNKKGIRYEVPCIISSMHSAMWFSLPH